MTKGIGGLMKECCATCDKQFILERYDFGGNNSQHSYEQGFACGIHMDDGIVAHMVGVTPEAERCDAWTMRT